MLTCSPRIMIKCFLCFSPLLRSPFSSFKVYPLFLGTGRHGFLYVCLSVCLSILLFLGTGGQLFSREERGYERDAEADILSSGARTRTSPDARAERGLGPFLGPFSRFSHTALSR